MIFYPIWPLSPGKPTTPLSPHGPGVPVWPLRPKNKNFVKKNLVEKKFQKNLIFFKFYLSLY
jgi:hypothetical protein